jgi:hypothetical protein
LSRFLIISSIKERNHETMTAAIPTWYQTTNKYFGEILVISIPNSNSRAGKGAGG